MNILDGYVPPNLEVAKPEDVFGTNPSPVPSNLESASILSSKLRTIVRGNDAVYARIVAQLASDAIDCLIKHIREIESRINQNN